MPLDENEKKDGQNLMVIVALKLLAAFILLGGGTVNVMRLDLNNHYEHVAGSLLSIVFLLGAGGYLIFSALKNLQKQNPALDSKKTAGIVLVSFVVLLVLALGVSGTQKYGMLCEYADGEQVVYRYKYSQFSSEFGARIDGEWNIFGPERIKINKGKITESSVTLIVENESDKTRQVMLFDFLLFEQVNVYENWDDKWTEYDRDVIKCRPMDLF